MSGGKVTPHANDWMHLFGGFLFGWGLAKLDELTEIAASAVEWMVQRRKAQ